MDHYVVTRAYRHTREEAPTWQILCRTFIKTEDHRPTFRTIEEIRKKRCLPLAFPTEEVAEAHRLLFTTEENYVSEVVRKTKEDTYLVLEIQKFDQRSAYLGREIAFKDQHKEKGVSLFHYLDLNTKAKYRVVGHLDNAARYSPLMGCCLHIFKKRLEELQSSSQNYQPLRYTRCFLILKLQEMDKPKRITPMQIHDSRNLLEKINLKRKVTEMLILEERAECYPEETLTKLDSQLYLSKQMVLLAEKKVPPKTLLQPSLVVPGMQSLLTQKMTVQDPPSVPLLMDRIEGLVGAWLKNHSNSPSKKRRLSPKERLPPWRDVASFQLADPFVEVASSWPLGLTASSLERVERPPLAEDEIVEIAEDPEEDQSQSPGPPPPLEASSPGIDFPASLSWELFDECSYLDDSLLCQGIVGEAM